MPIYDAADSLGQIQHIACFNFVLLAFSPMRKEIGIETDKPECHHSWSQPYSSFQEGKRESRQKFTQGIGVCCCWLGEQQMEGRDGGYDCS